MSAAETPLPPAKGDSSGSNIDSSKKPMKPPIARKASLTPKRASLTPDDSKQNIAILPGLLHGCNGVNTVNSTEDGKDEKNSFVVGAFEAKITVTPSQGTMSGLCFLNHFSTCC